MNNKFKTKVKINPYLGYIENNNEAIDISNISLEYVDFLIDINYQSWGIDGFNVFIPSQIITAKVNFLFYKDDDETKQTKEIIFDPNLLKIEKVNSNHITLGDIELDFGWNFEINYKKSFIEILMPINFK